MPKGEDRVRKGEMVLLLRMNSSGYSVWREDDLSIAGRFSTKRKANAYMRKLAKGNDSEFQNGQVSLENDIYQIVTVDLEALPLDPEPEVDEDLEEEAEA